LKEVEGEVRELKGALTSLEEYVNRLGLLNDPDRIGEEVIREVIRVIKEAEVRRHPGSI
jgi:hypothetical protein